MKDRLKSCDRWHVDIPSLLALRGRKDCRNGGQRRERRCRLCDRIRAKFKRAGVPVPPPSPYGYTPYGVIRLSWIPPEMVT